MYKSLIIIRILGAPKYIVHNTVIANKHFFFLDLFKKSLTLNQFSYHLIFKLKLYFNFLIDNKKGYDKY